VGMTYMATQQVQSISEKASDYRTAGGLFTFGGLFFLLLNTASESLYPNFSMLNNAMSDMAALGTRTTLIEETAIFGTAISWIVGAYILFRKTEKRGLLILNVLPGTGFLLAGISPENVNLVIHSLGALIAFPFGAIAVFLSYRFIRSDFRYFSLALGGLSVAATLVTFLGQRILGPCGTCVGKTPGYVQSLSQLGLGLGGWESMIVYPLLIWLIGFGSYLMAQGKRSERVE
jgi:hypothetical membrane protein